jgi:hypothetical protein
MGIVRAGAEEKAFSLAKSPPRHSPGGLSLT